MPRVPAIELCSSLQSRLEKIVIAESPTEPLFEVVACYGNKSLGQALADLVITKGRVCLIVPTGIRRFHDSFPSDRVLTQRYLEVDLLIADRAYYKSGQVAVFGGDKNLGVIEMGERVEAALDSVDLSSWGPAIFEDGAQQTIAASEKERTAGRETWIQSLLIPAGTSESVTV